MGAHKLLAQNHLILGLNYGAGDGNRTHTTSLEGWDSTIELHPHIWSGRRDSNPQPSPWQGDTLPLSHFRRLVQMTGVEPARRWR